MPLGQMKSKTSREKKEEVVESLRQSLTEHAYVWLLKPLNLRSQFLKDLRIRFRGSRSARPEFPPSPSLPQLLLRKEHLDADRSRSR